MFRAADAAFYAGRVEATTKNRESQYANWCAFVRPLGVDPALQDTPFNTRVRCLSGFAALTRSGYFGRGKQVQSGTVSSAITAVGKRINLAFGDNPTKTLGSDKFVPRLAEMIAGWYKEDPATKKKLPVEVDVPELLVSEARKPGATEKERAIGDDTLIAFYYLLRNGEYTVKEYGTADSQTEQFRIKDLTFFCYNSRGKLYQVSRRAPEHEIMTAACATLRLGNQKNGWKNVCINHEHNGDETFCPVRALGRRYCHILRNTIDMDTLLSSYWEGDTQADVTDNDIRGALKWAAVRLNYPTECGIPEELIDTHSLRIGGACALALAGYSETEIQKMGRWRGATFKEYIREQLEGYSKGMSKSMEKVHGFVNIAGGADTDVPVDVTNTVVTMEFNLLPQ